MCVIEEIMEDVSTKSEIMHLLEKAATPEDVLDILKDQGYDVTIEQLWEYNLKSMEDRELNDDELDVISGGFYHHRQRERRRRHRSPGRPGRPGVPGETEPNPDYGGNIVKRMLVFTNWKKMMEERERRRREAMKDALNR